MRFRDQVPVHAETRCCIGHPLYCPRERRDNVRSAPSSRASTRRHGAQRVFDSCGILRVNRLGTLGKDVCQ
jgi:hypothetical protein